ncbi:MAG: GNAT family N-acetyltransferase [Candidatus Thorarchaeota archaeon]|jgi:GNAT superfamily N-acetyltransferase
MMVEEYSSEKRSDLLPLFENHPYLYALSEAFLKEGLGEAYVDSLDNPQVVYLNHRGIVFLSGDSNNASVPELLERVPQKNIIIVPSKNWEEKIKGFWGDKLKPYPRTKFSSEGLDIKHMKNIQERLPEGMVIEEVTRESIHQISDQAKGIIALLSPSLEKFMEKNFGFLIREGETIVSLALAGSPLYTNEFEIHIETHPDYQKRGLAMISAARLIQYSLENGMIPHWDADNPPSAKLATKLGFSNPEEYNAYYWMSQQPDDSV